MIFASNTGFERTARARSVYLPVAVKDVHIVVGCLALALNLLAFLLGGAAWLRVGRAAGSGGSLRAGQATVAVEAALGGVLLLMGARPRTCTTSTGCCRSWWR